jgi:hypothetical protein
MSDRVALGATRPLVWPSTGPHAALPESISHAVRSVGTGNAAELATHIVEKEKPFLLVVD